MAFYIYSKIVKNNLRYIFYKIIIKISIGSNSTLYINVNNEFFCCILNIECILHLVNNIRKSRLHVYVNYKKKYTTLF